MILLIYHHFFLGAQQYVLYRFVAVNFTSPYQLDMFATALKNRLVEYGFVEEQVHLMNLRIPV